MALLSPYKGKYLNAKVASVDLDVEGIIKSCEAIESDASRIDVLSSNIMSVGSIITPEVLSIDENNFSVPLENCCNGINSVSDNIFNVTSQIKERAVTIYNSLQSHYNEEAKILDKQLCEEKTKKVSV